MIVEREIGGAFANFYAAEAQHLINLKRSTSYIILTVIAKRLK